MQNSDFDIRYEVVMASDLQRDGMWLEFSDRLCGELVFLAFYSDIDGSMEFEKIQANLPPDAEAWFREEAIRRLPPCVSGSD
ncbi:hypothetical protein [Zavarzinella formosa]|uniref:hypothetical protein n=1 Tax=Zavarzinella formosa TaxID=360055 RepID=UPI00035FE4CB|nr:hypothetical protein [Zavarzinella formosa]